MLIIIRINFASKDLKMHFEGRAEGYSQGFYSRAGWDERGCWHSVTKLQTFPGQQRFLRPLMGGRAVPALLVL